MKKLFAFILNFLLGRIRTFDQFLEVIQKKEIKDVSITVRNTHLFPQLKASLNEATAYDLSIAAITTKGEMIDFIDTSFSLWSETYSINERIDEYNILIKAKEYAAKIEQIVPGISVEIFFEEKPIRVSSINLT
jgi:hypothetical protein